MEKWENIYISYNNYDGYQVCFFCFGNYYLDPYEDIYQISVSSFDMKK